MGMNLIEKIQAKLEVFRLEQRYTRRRTRRSTFTTDAIYVDGEYVFQTPSSTGSSADSSTSRIDALHGAKAVGFSASNSVAGTPIDEVADPIANMPMADRKRLHRFSSVPVFGGAFGGGNTEQKTTPSRMSRRTSMLR